jgi:hypothetical protein
LLVETAACGEDAPEANLLAKVEPKVLPGLNWSAVELDDFLNALPVSSPLNIRKAADPSEAIALTPMALEKQIVWNSSSILAYPLHDSTQVKYHELVQWVADEAGVEEWIRETQPTFVIERAILEQMFQDLWEKLPPAKREESLDKLDVDKSIRDRAAISLLSGVGAQAALSTTAYFAGFDFYITMSSTLFAAAGFFGVTLPFAVYQAASSTAPLIVAFGTSPVGWAILAVAAAASVALAGAPDVEKTAAAICQIHALKVASLQRRRKDVHRRFSPAWGSDRAAACR